jgi:uncharacterized membrane protein YheB (UPF0754 family)
MKTLLGYLLPPLIGAIIGFVTNAVAIRMLFRPLEEIRLFAVRGGAGGKSGRGIRLPFTPGILPRQRHKLADSIGAMVERELLTPRIIRDRLKSESVRRGAALPLSRFTEKILRTALGSFQAPLESFQSASGGLQPLPEGLAAEASGGASTQAGVLLFTEILRDFSRSPVFAELVDGLFAALLEAALKGPEAGTGGKPLLAMSLAEILGGERIAALREKQDAFIRKTLNEKMPSLSLKLGPLFFDLYPEAVSALFKLLDRQDVRRVLEIHGRVFLDNAIRKLSAVQRFFISAGQYDRTLNERMPEIIDDLAAQIENAISGNAIRRRAADYLSQAALSLAADPANYDRLLQLLCGALFAFEERPLGEILGGFGINSAAELAAGIRRFFAEGAARDADGASFPAFGEKKYAAAALAALKAFLAGHDTVTVGEFFAVDGEKKRRLDGAILEKLFSLLDSRAETVLETMDIRAMVTERINSLDMLRVERIVLDVVADQLKWINLFGAVLGAAIGGAQALVSALLR